MDPTPTSGTTPLESSLRNILKRDSILNVLTYKPQTPPMDPTPTSGPTPTWIFPPEYLEMRLHLECSTLETPNPINRPKPHIRTHPYLNIPSGISWNKTPSWIFPHINPKPHQWTPPLHQDPPPTIPDFGTFLYFDPHTPPVDLTPTIGPHPHIRTHPHSQNFLKFFLFNPWFCPYELH